MLCGLYTLITFATLFSLLNFYNKIKLFEKAKL